MEQNYGIACGPRMLKSYMEKVTAPRMEAIGITPSLAPFLGVVMHNEGISLKGVSDALYIDKAMATRNVTKLIDMGLVENTASGHMYSLRLTEEGHRRSKQVEKILFDEWDALLSDLTSEERVALDSIMKKVSERIKGVLQ